jgi:8-oxo-dGTP pyrophosphatase MutT (NUDIX family)
MTPTRRRRTVSCRQSTLACSATTVRPDDPSHRQRQLGAAGWGHDIGETIADAGVRETLEETGIKCEIVRLVGVYTNPRHVMHYTSNDEVRQECSLVFAARPVGGERKTSSESREVLWVEPDELDEYPMHDSMRQRVQHLLARRDAPFIG